MARGCNSDRRGAAVRGHEGEGIMTTMLDLWNWDRGKREDRLESLGSVGWRIIYSCCMDVGYAVIA